MNVSGLTEALATAVAVRLPNGLSIEVASLPAQAVLKIWAWEDRKYTTPGKDASDLWIFLRHYAEAGNEDRLYGQEAKLPLPHSILTSKRRAPGCSAGMRVKSWLTAATLGAPSRPSMRS
jgi:predicted nucleotidyltransferase